MNNSAFFVAGNKNFISGADTALTIDGLTKAEVAYYDLVDADGKPIGTMPTILLVPTALSAIGTQLYKSLEMRDNTANARMPINNPHAGKFRVEVSRYLGNSNYTGNSTKAWYLLSDPNDLPLIEVAFLNGQIHRLSGDIFMMNDPSDCQYNEFGYCKISSDLAKAPVPIASDACAACVQQTRPRTKNSVTCSKAIEYLSIVQMPIPQDLLECVKPPTQGVGTELETLIAKTRKFLSWFCLAWIIPTGFTCGCHSTKRRMNELGPRLCTRDGDELSAEILKHWILHVPMIRFIPFVLTIIGLYILRASYNAESKEKLNG